VIKKGNVKEEGSVRKESDRRDRDEDATLQHWRKGGMRGIVIKKVRV
jgi:hypothetical protein